MKKIILILFFVPIIINAQKNKLSFDIGVGKNSYKMEAINKFYFDSFSIPNRIFDKNINKGQNIFINLKYQPYMFFDIGIYGNYQYGEINYTKELILTDMYGDSEIYIGKHNLKTEALSFGLINSWYINEILKFQNKESKFIQNSIIAIELNAGVSFSKVSFDFIYPSLKTASAYYSFSSLNDFQGHVSLKYEYVYMKKPIISIIGLKVGYQYIVTKNVKDKYNEIWIVKENKPINLDFSGFVYSIYLSFGK